MVKNREPGTPAVRPRLAATLMIVRDGQKGPEILMGCRSKKHDFMPSVYVFPGGRVDPCDSYIVPKSGFSQRTENVLSGILPPARARAAALACIRETYEETGLILGDIGPARQTRSQNSSWQKLMAGGQIPDLSQLEVIGRAITPPYRSKRFDTLFFLTRLNSAAARRSFVDSAELHDVKWIALSQTGGLETHRATQMMLGELQSCLAKPALPEDILFSRLERGRHIFDRYSPA